MKPFFLLSAVSLFYILLITGFSEGKSNDAAEQVTEQAALARTITLAQPHYVGRKTCQSCHAKQDALWQGSHHDLAMQEATADTVLGDFNNVSFSIAGRTSTFTQKDARYFVETEGKDGKLKKFEIKYTFGAIPLQQYLIEFADGRFQTLGIAWDSRTKEQGGQRWFHLYPENPPKPGEPLHWSGIDQAWNYQCAECHSTNLLKNYNPKTDRYATTWSELDVSCEACHGPASNHLLWADKHAGWEQMPNRGLAIRFDERKDAVWIMDSDNGNARRNKPLTQRKEIDICARCHSRRGIISEAYQHGKSIHDTHRVSWLRDGLYYPDGQIRDEVYVYGSFLQSKMYHAGVTCSDCHEPHSLKLLAEGNGVCLQCHDAGKFNLPAHHKHTMGTLGANCVECHMPETNYMVIDPRRDHSIRIPRPDLSLKLGVPNACTRCHTERTQAWAAERMQTWYGASKNDWQDFATVLHEARRGNPAALPDLERLIGSEQTPAIIRATLLGEFSRYLSPASLSLLVDALYEEDPLIRLAATSALAGTDSSLRLQLLFPFLDDPVRAVRLEAARLLMDLPVSQLTRQQHEKLSEVHEAYAVSLKVNHDRPEAMMQLGVLHSAQGRLQEAEHAYQRAIYLDKHFSGAYVNLADLLSGQNREAQAMSALQQGLAVMPDDPDLHHALGLSLVRAKRYEEAVPALAEAAKRAPENARYPYVYAIALQSTGNIEQAIRTLEQAMQQHPYDRQITAALVSFYRDTGEMDKATEIVKRLQ